ADGSAFSSSGGEVALSDGSRLEFAITSQRYKQWEVARSGLSRTVATRFGQILQPKSPTRHSIDRAVAYLESDLRSKQAIERAGMSVRDFVLMTVALEQEMQLASGKGAAAADEDRTSIPPSYPYPTDTMVRPTPMPAPAPMPRADTVRRDTVVP